MPKYAETELPEARPMTQGSRRERKLKEGRDRPGGAASACRCNVLAAVFGVLCLLLAAALIVVVVLLIKKESGDGGEEELVGEKGCSFLVSDWADYSISRLDDAGGSDAIVLDLYQPHKITVDRSIETFFFTQCAIDGNLVQKAPLSSPSSVTLLADDLACPVGVAVAPRDKLLFVGSRNTAIYKMAYDGGEREAVIMNDIGEVWGIVAHEVTATLYWVDQNNRLESATYLSTGLNRRLILSSSGESTFTGLTADLIGGWLYWSDVSGTIKATRFEGGEVKLVYDGAEDDRVSSVAYCRNKIYFTEWNKNKAVMAVSIDGGSAVKIKDFREPFGIATISEGL